MTENPVYSSKTSESSYSKAEINSTISSHEIENTSFQLTIEKLNGRNFKEWAQSMKLVVDSKGKLGYLTGDTKKTTYSTQLQRWKSENFMVIAWLVNSMHPSIGKTYLSLPTAKDIWDVIKLVHTDKKLILDF